MDGPGYFHGYIGIHRFEYAFEVVATIGRYSNHWDDGLVNVHRYRTSGFAAGPIRIGMYAKGHNAWG